MVRRPRLAALCDRASKPNRTGTIIMSDDKKIQCAIARYLTARHQLIEFAKDYPARIGGNDNIIGRIGEFIALRFLELRGQSPRKHKSSSNEGFDLYEGRRKTQVKVITEENKTGRTTRLPKEWHQFILIELGSKYKCIRIGMLTSAQHRRARQANSRLSSRPFAARTMLNANGLISRYGSFASKEELEQLAG
jgi:hypothetical protein